MDMKEFLDSKVADKHEIIKINLDKFGNDIGVIEDVDEARQVDIERSLQARDTYKHKYDHLRTGSPTIINAKGKKMLLVDMVKKEAKVGAKVGAKAAIADAPKKIVKDTLTHLAKMVKGIFSSPMAKDKDFSQFCEESINALIQKETEGLCRLNNISEPNSVYVKKSPLQTLGGGFDTFKKSKNNPLRSNEQFLDCMEIQDMRELSHEDSEALMNKVFTDFDGVKHMETDHFYRYFVEQMLKSDSKEFAELVKDMDLSNTNINRLKEILRLEKEKLAKEAQKVLDKSELQTKVVKEAREKGWVKEGKLWMGQPDILWRNDPEAWLLEQKERAEKKAKKKKVVEKEVAHKKATKKRTAKKRTAKKKVSKKIIADRQKKMADRVTYSELHVPGKKVVIKGTKQGAKKKVSKKKVSKKKVAKKKTTKKVAKKKKTTKKKVAKKRSSK